MDNRSQTYNDTTITAASEQHDFSYHRIEVEADDSYRIDLWKDGAIARGRNGHRLKKNTNPGVEIAIEADDGALPSHRERIKPGRSSDTSHYADLRDLDSETLDAAEAVINNYLEQTDETGTVQDAVSRFFDDVEDGLLEQ